MTLSLIVLLPQFVLWRRPRWPATLPQRAQVKWVWKMEATATMPASPRLTRVIPSPAEAWAADRWRKWKSTAWSTNETTRLMLSRMWTSENYFAPHFDLRVDTDTRLFFMKWTCEFFFWYKAGSQELFSIPVKERIPKSRKLTITIHLHSTESTPYMDLPLLNSTWASNIPFFNIDSMYIVTYIIIHIYLVIIILILLKVKYQ